MLGDSAVRDSQIRAPDTSAIVLVATLGIAALPPHGRRGPGRSVPGVPVPRCALPPDQLHAAGHGHPQVPGRDHGRQGRPLHAVRHPAAADLVVRELGRLRADLLPAIRRAAVLLLVHRRVHRERIPEARAGAAQAHRPDDHGIQSGRHVCGGPHPARARDLPGRVHAESASSRSTRSSSPQRSRATPPA